MTEWVEIGSLSDLQRKRKAVVQVGGEDVVLFAISDRVYAMADVCVHKQKRLSKGLIFKGKVICPGHQWAFDLETGWVDEWATCQPTYETKIENGLVMVNPIPRIRSEPPACQTVQAF